MSNNEEGLIKLIIKANIVSKSDLDASIKVAQHLGCSVTDVLTGRGHILEEDLGKILSKYYKTDFINLKKIHIPQKFIKTLPESLAVEKNVIVFSLKNNDLYLAMENPNDLDIIELVKKTLGNKYKINAKVATLEGIKEALKIYKEETLGISKKEEPANKDNLTAVLLIEKMLEDAYREEASDIHFEPLNNNLLVRFRIDGVLHDQMNLNKELHASIVARIKILSKLKLDETRLPQDGQLGFRSKGGESFSVRVSIIPTVLGEKIVMRILKNSLNILSLQDLGLLAEDQDVIANILSRTHGMLLVTGPTGSGKTTTLYTILGLLNNSDVNIVTIEDPVENKIGRVNQIQVNQAINLTFATGLRSVLRQDPDIIMVGEIRDQETAIISVNAAMTGHMVISSVHANTAAGAIPRMIDLGTESFLLASTLNMVLAQRLVRILCPKCKYRISISSILKEKMSENNSRVSKDILNKLKNNYASKGCNFCHHTGYRGRTGIFEIIRIDDILRELIVSKSASNIIWNQARKNGAKSMLEDGLIKVTKEITSLEEVFRVISE